MVEPIESLLKYTASSDVATKSVTMTMRNSKLNDPSHVKSKTKMTSHWMSDVGDIVHNHQSHFDIPTAIEQSERDKTEVKLLSSSRVEENGEKMP